MRKHLLRRTGLVLAIALGLLLSTSPAQATTTGKFTFVGNATINPGFDFPCRENTPQKPCPPRFFVTKQIDPKLGSTQALYMDSGQIATLTINSIVCVDTKLSTLNKPKLPVAAGPCTITITGQLRGFCGLATGRGTVTVKSSNGTIYGFNNATWLQLGDKFVVSAGTADKNIYGTLDWMWGPGCQDKSATTATVWGTLTLKWLTGSVV